MQQQLHQSDGSILRERGRGKRVLALDGALESGRQIRPLHRDATPEQRKLREWLVPIIERLSLEHQDLIHATFYERTTFEVVKERTDSHDRGGAARKLETALRALTRLIAEQDPEFLEAEAAKPRRRGGQARDYDAERAAAYRVYLRVLGHED